MSKLILTMKLSWTSNVFLINLFFSLAYKTSSASAAGYRRWQKILLHWKKKQFSSLFDNIMWRIYKKSNHTCVLSTYDFCNSFDLLWFTNATLRSQCWCNCFVLDNSELLLICLISAFQAIRKSILFCRALESRW